jgi:glutathione synthase
MDYPPKLDEAETDKLIESISHWSLANGLALLTPDAKGSTALVAPITLYPTKFPNTAFEEAISVQKTFNSLYHGVVKHEKWLLEIMKELATFDPDFTGKLLDIHLRLSNKPVTQYLTAGLFRSDYIVHKGSQIKQVEFNTVSVSFGGLSSKVSKLHRYRAISRK